MAVWVKLVPLILLAVWVPYRRRDLNRACIAPVVLSVALTGLLLALDGPTGISAMVSAMAFQFQRGSFFAPWYTFDVGWLQPLAQAAVLALLLTFVLLLRADRAARQDIVRLSAIAAALLLGMQLAANYWTWSYLPWVLPFLLLALLLADSPTSSALSTPATRARRSPAMRPARPGLRGRPRSPSAAGSVR